ncbi:hypothetical protein CPAR01_08715 [Colletotrichum paranaense]|uniref:Uncharacterized protein n=1 Tax=Colletotrichum paranaense TaxID=1914294 RepID=A0ABQ9SMD7_9PEZI|nr:uncharacterized protein CPAR01_08715 [Colletotrichum paranaense]KAK1538602.1 hypothetical protein CPAR01_08715 [Colletotrichum paranaense]
MRSLDYAPQFGGKHAYSRYPYGYIHHCHTPRLDKRPHEQYNYRHIMPRQGEAQNLTGRNLVVRQGLVRTLRLQVLITSHLLLVCRKPTFTPPLWAEFHTRPTEAIVQPDAASSCQANPTFSTSATFAIEQWEPFTGLPVHV